jgi:hypothetical protein
MKLQPVSFASNKSYRASDQRFLLMPKAQTAPMHQNVGKRSFFTTAGILALAAVVFTIARMKGKNILPDDIVELTGKEVGLNRLDEKKYSKTVSRLKKHILYPMKSALLGNKSFIREHDAKSGVILDHFDSDVLKEVRNAFVEHAEALGVNVVRLPISKGDKKFPVEYLRDTRKKWLLRMVKDANKRYETEDKITLIDLGDLGKTAKLGRRSTKSQVEEILEMTGKYRSPGVFWVGWCDKPNTLSPFYMRESVLITKPEGSVL